MNVVDPQARGVRDDPGLRHLAAAADHEARGHGAAEGVLVFPALGVQLALVAETELVFVREDRGAHGVRVDRAEHHALLGPAAADLHASAAADDAVAVARGALAGADAPAAAAV